jgi:hypothetical protein
MTSIPFSTLSSSTPTATLRRALFALKVATVVATFAVMTAIAVWYSQGEDQMTAAEIAAHSDLQQ